MFEPKIEKMTGGWRKLHAEDSELDLFIESSEHLGHG